MGWSGGKWNVAKGEGWNEIGEMEWNGKEMSGVDGK